MPLLRGGCVLCGAGADPLCAGCGRHLDPPPTTSVRGVGPVPALFAYDGTGTRVVQALKFRDGRRLVGPLADGLVGLAGAGTPALVSWVPTTKARRRQRGFDQAELLARAVARRLGVPCRPVLRRRPGPSQTGRTRAERSGNVAFEPGRRPPRGLPVLVVDDVCTTGATLRAAATVLAGAGVGAVRFVTVARTP